MSEPEVPLEPNQPRDSRLDAFLRRATSILAEQRQWSAQTQIKLKVLAKELKLPPELFQTALEQLADPTRTATLTRYEQAFCEYLERQFGTLTDLILSRTQEKKAITYGQQKFQLTPDACERCIVRVAEKLNVSRISDGQALAYAQGEISRLVGRADLEEDQLHEQVQTLATQWAIEPQQIEKLLQNEISRRVAKKRRALIHRISIALGLVVLSIGLIVSIIVLGKTLTQESNWQVQKDETQNGEIPVTRPDLGIKPPAELMAPVWWTPNQKQLLERLQEEDFDRAVLSALTSHDSAQRAKAYPQIWQLLAARDRELVANGSEEVRWLRQPMVQESMLDWFWNEPETAAARELISALDRSSALELSDELDANAEIRTRTGLGLESLSGFLNGTDADHLLLRAFQKCVSQTLSDSIPPNMQSRIELIRSLQPSWRTTDLRRQSDATIAVFRNQWLSEATERCYFRMQSLWREKEESKSVDDGSATADEAWKKAVATAVEPLRLVTDQQTRAQLLIVFWSAVVAVDPTLSETAWPDIAESMEVVSPRDWGPLVESWSIVPTDSAWSTRLQIKWQAIAESKQRAWSDQKTLDTIWLQNSLGIEIIATEFQRRLRRELVLAEFKELESRFPANGPNQDLVAWENLSRVTSLADCLVNDSNFRMFDQVLLQSKVNSESPVAANLDPAFVPDSEFNRVWAQLPTADHVENYTQAVQTVVIWWQQNQLLSIPQARRLVDHLKTVTKPEQQTSWLIAFQKLNGTQGQRSNSANNESLDNRLSWTALGQLANQPSVAIALADCLESDANDFQTGLSWLSATGSVASSDLPGVEPMLNSLESKSAVLWLRRIAFHRLQQHENSGGNVLSKYLGNRYEIAFRSERARSGNRLTFSGQSALGNPSSMEKLTRILLVHDVWAAKLAVELLDDGNAWLKEYRAQVDQQISMEKKLWVAEWLALKLLQQSIEQETP